MSKPGFGFDGYEITEDGRVLSLKSGKWLKPKIDKYGYAVYTLFQNGKAYYRTAHRLVASTFIPNPKGLPCVNHINENKLDNRVENLEWCTVRQNNTHGTRNERMSRSKCHRPVIQTLDSEERRYQGVKAASRKTGIAHSQISKHCKDGLPTTDGSRWRYINE